MCGVGMKRVKIAKVAWMAGWFFGAIGSEVGSCVGNGRGRVFGQDAAWFLWGERGGNFPSWISTLLAHWRGFWSLKLEV
jgi:hypothetical protein